MANALVTRLRPLAKPAVRGLAVAAVAVAGTWAGLALAGRTGATLGPLRAEIHLSLSPSGQTVVDVPPLGALRLDSHKGPLQIGIDIERLQAQDVRAAISDPKALQALPDRLVGDLRHAIVRIAVRSLLAAVAGSLLLGLLAFRRLGATLVAGAVALVLMAGGGAVAAVTWNPNSILEPHYSGLLAGAPALVGSAQNIVTRFQSYRAEIARLATNVSRLYAATSTLPTFTPDASTLRILTVADIHDNPEAFSVMHSLVSQFSVDLIVDAGDLTDHGSKPEDALAGQISTFSIPYVWVKGNHDSDGTQAAVARQPNAVVLTGTAVAVDGLSFIGDADPRFTPDLLVKAPGEDEVLAIGQRLAAAARGQATPPDIAVVHDPAATPPLAGAVALALAGHTHKRSDSMLGNGTRLLVQGSTGGAGLRALESNPPTPIECSVLYIDRTTRKLQAWDDITLGGLGATSAMIERHLAETPVVAPSPTETATPGETETATPSETVLASATVSSPAAVPGP